MTTGHPAEGSLHSPAPHLRLPDWGWDVIAVVVVVATAIVPGPRPPFMHPTDSPLFVVPVMLIVPAVLTAGLLLLRRRWPIPIFIACALIYCVTALIGVSSIGAGIATIIAAFGVANLTNRRTSFLTGGIAAAVVAALSITATEWGVIDTRVFQVAAGIAVAAALGDSSRSRREYVAAVTERAERAERTREAESQRRVAEERLRIAQDLHDTVAHRISVISLNAGVATGALDERPEKAREALSTIRTAARGVLNEISDLLRYLRTNEDSTQALPPQVGLQHLQTLIQRMSAAGLQIRTQITGNLSDITGSTDLVAYRIVQEGLTNAHKHGSNQTAEVILIVSADMLSVTITNPIAPGSTTTDAPGDRLGLLGMQERVASVRGTVTAGAVGDTFRLVAQLPLPQENHA